MGTSKNRFEKGKWVECAECDESLLVRLYALRGGLKKQAVCYTHFHSNKVFRGDLKENNPDIINPINQSGGTDEMEYIPRIRLLKNALNRLKRALPQSQNIP